jgi:hypothetical protein
MDGARVADKIVPCFGDHLISAPPGSLVDAHPSDRAGRTRLRSVFTSNRLLTERVLPERTRSVVGCGWRCIPPT